MRRPIYAQSTSEDLAIINEAEAIHTIEFVLFGEIIDYVFKEFLSNKNQPVSYQAALFSAFSFGLYEQYSLQEVDRVIPMKDVPVSIDLLWDLLYDSRITDSNAGKIMKANYYSDLISKAYSAIYRSCDKSVNYLSHHGDTSQSAPTIRKVGTPEINAIEVYVPKLVFTEVLNQTRNREVNNRILTQEEIDKMMLFIAKNSSQGSQVSDPPDASNHCRIMFFTSHVPYVASSSRQPDFSFTAYGQYGIVKSLSYSPVPVDGLLESAIASRSKDQESKVDAESSDNFYKTLLKVDINTFGYPVIFPGMTVEVDKVLLSVDEGSTISNSLTNSFYITRVTTKMNKGDYTTTIEGYPRFPKPPKSDQKESSIKFTKASKATILNDLKSYSDYILSGNTRPESNNLLSRIRSYYSKWLERPAPRHRKSPSFARSSLHDFFPQPFFGADLEKKMFIDSGNFLESKKKFVGKKADPRGWALVETHPAAIIIKPYLKGDSALKYEISKNPVEVSIETMKRVRIKTDAAAASLASEFGLTSPDDDLKYGKYFNEIISNLRRSMDNPALGKPLQSHHQGILMMLDAISVWRDSMKELATTSADSDTTAAFNELLNHEQSCLSDDGYGEMLKFASDLSMNLDADYNEAQITELTNLIDDVLE